MKLTFFRLFAFVAAFNWRSSHRRADYAQHARDLWAYGKLLALSFLMVVTLLALFTLAPVFLPLNMLWRYLFQPLYVVLFTRAKLEMFIVSQQPPEF